MRFVAKPIRIYLNWSTDMAGAKKKKQNVYRFYNGETGEHYTIRLSKEAYEKLADKPIKKFSKKKNQHVDFKLIKKVK